MSLSTFIKEQDATKQKLIQFTEGDIARAHKDVEALREMVKSQDQQIKVLREETWLLKDENHLLQMQVRTSLQGKPEMCKHGQGA